LEEVLLYYKICKIKGLNYKKMIIYFEKAVHELISAKNNELLLKIALDLIETFKFKVNEVE
jgi:hypothetical protein